MIDNIILILTIGVIIFVAFTAFGTKKENKLDISMVLDSNASTKDKILGYLMCLAQKKWFAVLLIGVFLLVWCSDGTRTFSSKEDAKKYISGETFIATPKGEMWYKITFDKSGGYTMWAAMPTAGNWGSPMLSGYYDVRENRYSDTGQVYYYVKLGSGVQCWDFNITGIALYHCLNGNDAIPMKNTNKNPW